MNESRALPVQRFFSCESCARDETNDFKPLSSRNYAALQTLLFGYGTCNVQEHLLHMRNRMLWTIFRAIWLGFLIAALAHVAAAITVMFFDDHHTMGATIVRSILIALLVSPVLAYLLWQKENQSEAMDFRE
ncbi:hypothetical protein RZ532_17610 [Nitratireductor aquimarinus]|uniref:hypothetical protein n=1 Tax=Nitratireductor aquimarinus TaxID=889300 RepID=UPI002935A0FC|nr:hypothetical protein [Nitratireductor aquimarinus]MDV2967813.1 hypothetical protein [Nitratireductor aquimarinus]